MVTGANHCDCGLLTTTRRSFIGVAGDSDVAVVVVVVAVVVVVSRFSVGNKEDEEDDDGFRIRLDL